MGNGRYLLHLTCLALILFFLSQNYRGIRTIKRQEELLDTHLNRLIIENDKYEKLFRNGLLVTRLNDYYRNKYFDEKNQLKAEFIYNRQAGFETNLALKEEHRRDEQFGEYFHDLFSHTSLFVEYEIIKKSIIDKRVHLGEYRSSLYKSGKYEVFINNVQYPFSNIDLYEVECLDTLNLQMNILSINHKTYDIDTTIVKEQLIVSDL